VINRQRRNASLSIHRPLANYTPVIHPQLLSTVGTTWP
jgi:hypothetical protein